MLKTTILAALLITGATAEARGYLSKADTMQTPSGVYNATTKQQETTPMIPEFTAEDAALIATKVSDLLEFGELNGRTAALLRHDRMPHLNAAVDDYTRAMRHLETKRRVLENELLRIDQDWSGESYQ